MDLYFLGRGSSWNDKDD